MLLVFFFLCQNANRECKNIVGVEGDGMIWLMEPNGHKVETMSTNARNSNGASNNTGQLKNQSELCNLILCV